MSSKDMSMMFEAINEENNPLIPKLRFPEFHEAKGWRFEQLGTLAKRRAEKNISGKHTRVLTNSAEYGVVDQRDFFEKDIATQGNLEGYYIVEKGDYVYNPRISTRAPVGPISKNNIGTGVMSPLYTVFRFVSSENDFFAYYFKSAHWHRYMRQASSTGARHDRMSMTNDDFMRLPLPVSTPEEQTKIAACFSSLDNLIAAECKKLNALKIQRMALMQQMFPCNGKSAPNRRFPEYRNRGPWKTKTLADIATIRSGSTPSRAEPAFYSGGTIPWVKTTDLNNDLIYCTEECVTPAARAKINPVGSVLVAMYGGFKQIGRTGYLTMPAATNQAISVLNSNENEVLPIYLLTWLNVRVEDWKKIASSSRKDPNITSVDVAKFPILYPEKDEQRRIADVVVSLNDSIAAQTQKIETLKVHKAGLMQQLFPIRDEAQE